MTTVDLLAKVRAAADALAQEAFRRDTKGDTALLEEAKILLRGYLTDIAARYNGS